MFGGVFSWSNVLYERVYPGGDLLIQFVGRDAYKQFWNFSKDEKENLATQLAIELPALRGKVGCKMEKLETLPLRIKNKIDKLGLSGMIKFAVKRLLGKSL